MEIIIPQPKRKKKFNPYDAALDTLWFLGRFGWLVLIVVGGGAFLFGVFTVPETPTTTFAHITLFAAIIGSLALVVGLVWFLIVTVTWLVDEGYMDIIRWLEDKAHSYGKVSD